MIDARELTRRDRREDSPYPAADDPAVLGPILDELDADDDARELAYRIAAAVEATMWVVGRRRSTVAATVVYAAGEVLGEVGPRFTQTDVAAAGGVAVTSIAKYRGDVLDIYEAVSADGDR